MCHEGRRGREAVKSSIIIENRNRNRGSREHLGKVPLLHGQYIALSLSTVLPVWKILLRGLRKSKKNGFGFMLREVKALLLQNTKRRNKIKRKKKRPQPRIKRLEPLFF